jgi:hypothetical protein
MSHVHNSCMLLSSSGFIMDVKLVSSSGFNLSLKLLPAVAVSTIGFAEAKDPLLLQDLQISLVCLLP